MDALAARDLRAVLDFLGDVRDLPDLPSFRIGILPGLSRLIAGNLWGYNEVDPVARTSFVICDPEGVVAGDVDEKLGRLAAQHPLIMRQAAGDHSAATISEFLTRRHFHRLELYHEIYRPIDAEDQLAIGVAGDSIIGIAVNRDRRTFTDRDRAVLDAVRPHLAATLADLQSREEALALIALLEDGLEETGRAVVLLEADGRVAHMGPVARAMLDVYRVDAEDPPAEIAGPRGTLRIRRVCGPDQPALLLHEQREDALDLAALRDIGLTPRQAEVLRLAALGLSNEAIARELFLSPRTVEKHMEHLCERLGARNRAGAVAEAMRRVGG